MTNFEKVMSVATPTWLAFLLSQGFMDCDKCVAKEICNKKEHKNPYACIDEIRQWLESETKEEIK